VTKVWLITCNCRALVHALAEAVLASGDNLVATAIDAGPLSELVELYGDQLRIVPVEVTDTLAAQTAIQATLKEFGRLDVLVLDLARWRSAASHTTVQQMAALSFARAIYAQDAPQLPADAPRSASLEPVPTAAAANDRTRHTAVGRWLDAIDQRD
jgi:NAD(P)-dependent dehydrogenase (short-subunit alcohol dehydrogenase family)